MAVKRVITTETETQGEEKETPEPMEADLLRALTELEGSGDVRWQIYRTSAPNAGYVCTLSTAELSMERVAELGAGKYMVKGIKPNGEYYKSRTIEIAARPEKPSASVDQIAELMKKSGGDSGNGLMQMVLAMIQSNGTIVASALARPPESKSEFPWPAVITAIPASLIAIKELFANKSDDAAMDKILKLVTVVDKLKGNDDSKGSTWTDVVRDALSSLPAALKSMSPAGDLSQSIPRSSVDLGTAISLPAADQLPEAVTPAETSPSYHVNFFREKLRELASKAQLNRNPELQAELLLEEKPAFVSDDMIEQLLMREDWWQQLQLFEPAIAPYAGWFEQLRAEILSLLQMTDKEPDHEPERRGNTDESTAGGTHDGG